MPRKEQRPCDYRNLEWSTDKGRFGYQMLEKMGWKQGKGLGAKEDGTTEHVKVKRRLDNQGVGTETVNPSRNWLSTSVAYESILATLNLSYGNTTTSAPAATTPSESSGAEKAKKAETSQSASRVVGRPRKVLYSRMLRAKDLANYSQEDKSAIFGGVPQGTAQPTEDSTKQEDLVAQQEVESESEEVEEEQKVKKKKSGQKRNIEKEEEDEDKDYISGVTTTTSAISMQDYFKKKMAEMAMKRAEAANVMANKTTELEMPQSTQLSSAIKGKSQEKKRKRSEDDQKRSKKSKKKKPSEPKEKKSKKNKKSNSKKTEKNQQKNEDNRERKKSSKKKQKA